MLSMPRSPHLGFFRIKDWHRHFHVKRDTVKKTACVPIGLRLTVVDPDRLEDFKTALSDLSHRFDTATSTLNISNYIQGRIKLLPAGPGPDMLRPLARARTWSFPDAAALPLAGR